MAESNIEWTSKVWNPTTGCNKVSQGCKNCYAEKMHKRLIGMHPDKYKHSFLDGAFEHEPALEIPFKWKKGTLVFVNSMSDLFHENISVKFIAKVYAVMFLNQQHTFQLLTKRPERRLEVLNSGEFKESFLEHCKLFNQNFALGSWSNYEVLSAFPLRNVHEGVSIEDQSTAEERIPILLQTPASVRWVSAEPLLGPIDFAKLLDYSQEKDLENTIWPALDWIVVGGESGHRKRIFDPDWARTIRDYCKVMGIKFFMKQIDKIQEIPADLMIRERI